MCLEGSIHLIAVGVPMTTPVTMFFNLLPDSSLSVGSAPASGATALGRALPWDRSRNDGDKQSNRWSLGDRQSSLVSPLGDGNHLDMMAT